MADRGEVVDAVITSPPFFALRDYTDSPDEIGDGAPGDYLDDLLDVVARCGEILAPHGNLAVEIQDCSAGSGGAGGDYGPGGGREGQPKWAGTAAAQRAYPDAEWPTRQSLMGIPEAFQVALTYGINPITGAESPAGKWAVRDVIVWARAGQYGPGHNRLARRTSRIVVAARNPRLRWFDPDVDDGLVGDVWENNDRNRLAGKVPHTAMWPESIAAGLVARFCPVRVCVECGAPSRPQVPVCACNVDDTGGEHGRYWRAGVVLDPFAGSGTTVAVATGHGRSVVGVDLDPVMVDVVRDRVGMFPPLDVVDHS
jgi:hypothetical protein